MSNQEKDSDQSAKNRKEKQVSQDSGPFHLKIPEDVLSAISTPAPEMSRKTTSSSRSTTPIVSRNTTPFVSRSTTPAPEKLNRSATPSTPEKASRSSMIIDPSRLVRIPKIRLPSSMMLLEDPPKEAQDHQKIQKHKSLEDEGEFWL